MGESILWIPETAKELLCFDSSEVHDLDAQIFINRALVSWLNGKLDTGTLTDMLLQHDINPGILDNFERHIDFMYKLC